MSHMCRCVLAVIIMVNLRGSLRKFLDVPGMWRADRIDASIWLVTMASSALVNTELGLLVGVLASAFCVLGRTQKARVLELGRAGTREHYEHLSSYRGLRTHPGVAVFRYEAPIYYANQSLFKKSLYKRVGLNPAREKAQRLKSEKIKQRETGGAPGVQSGEKTCEKNDVEAVPSVLEEKPSRSARSLVIDCSAVLFLDTAGVSALKEVRRDYGDVGVEVILTQCNTSVLDSLEKGGYYDGEKDGEVGKNKLIFFTITDAVQHVQSLGVPNGDCADKSY